MVPLPLLDGGELDLVVVYSVDTDERMTEAIVSAFRAVEVDAFEESTRLVDWVDPDVLEKLRWSPDQPLYLYTRIWDHDVVVKPDEVRIYSTSGDA